MKAAFNILIFICLLLWCINATAQRNNVWCFGHNAGVDFSNLQIPTAISSSVLSRGSCASICNTSGQLLFTASPDIDVFATGYVTNGEINNPNGDIMVNGDSIVALGWYQEMTIIPIPDDTSKYYVFSVGVTTDPGLWFSEVDMNLNNGQGAVTQKNVQLLNFLMVDCITAIRHGNGRDWWLMVRKSTFNTQTSNNTWYLFLISPSGITAMPVQNVGTLNGTNSGKLSVNTEGNQFAFTGLGGLLEIYNFDRCTGVVYNSTNIENVPSLPPYPYFFSNEFSPNGRFLYVTSSTNPISRLWQYDTWAPNIFASKTLIWQTSLPPYTIGALKRGPDDKIYLSCAWIQSNGWNYYPYDSTMYYPENMNLSVINSPDSAGAACDFQPWSFYLGGKRTYWGLPNNPDYDLGPLAGSPCDTLTSLNETVAAVASSGLYVYYSLQWQTAFINADKLSGTTYRLSVYDLMGKEVFSESGKITPPYFTKNLNCGGWAKGMYVVSLECGEERLVKKFVVE